MITHYMTQADVVLHDAARTHARFWMDTCGGRDQVAHAVMKQGWTSYETPLPELVATWSAAFNPVLIDVGANTGFYSLLALACGAPEVHAFEPVTEIADVLWINAKCSEISDRLYLHREALGAASGTSTLYFPNKSHGLVETSASLNPSFRAQHSEQRSVNVRSLDDVMLTQQWQASSTQRFLLKLDVESHEPQVLSGANQLLTTLRPALVCEILPGVDVDFYVAMMQRHGYAHFALSPQGLRATEIIEGSDVTRDHVFLPLDDLGEWLDTVGLLRG